MKFISTILVWLLLFLIPSCSTPPASTEIRFSPSQLQGIPDLKRPTSLQFGPDGRLYVSQQDGSIQILTIQRKGPSNYHVAKKEVLNLIRRIPNHNDNGKLSAAPNRQVTGILVTGTASFPLLYVSSSDSRYLTRSDTKLCTNSGIISRVAWNGSSWKKIDLVRGLPRSRSNHSINGMQLDEKRKILYVAAGGNTNAGAPSTKFGNLCEYVLSGSILAIDLKAISVMPLKGTNMRHPYLYDLPTLDDPTRPNGADGSDIGDPFGGNEGLNQARIVPNGPVQIFAAGFRNPYDLLLTRTNGKERRLYTVDNGPNTGWGGYPGGIRPQYKMTNYMNSEPTSSTINQPEMKNLDRLHFIGNIDSYIPGSYSGTHPNPTRANPSGAGLYTHTSRSGSSGVWRTSAKDPFNPLPSDWPPVPLKMVSSIHQDRDLSLLTFVESTNGLTEYTASTWNHSMKGDLLTISFDGILHRIRLNKEGNAVLNKKGPDRQDADPPLASGFGFKPLDVTAQGDGAIFPGTIWVAVYGNNKIVVFEPDTGTCRAAYNSRDEDGDHFSNQDEMDNMTDPCSSASMPQDYDQDFKSDRNDADDDNDNVPDTVDLFVLDSQNGSLLTLPVHLDFQPASGRGFFGLGFTGIMADGKSDYQKLFNQDNLISGAAVGAFTIEKVTSGTALENKNDQQNAFQFGLTIQPGTDSINVRTGMLGPFFYKNVQGSPFQGFFIGTGDQDHYLEISLSSNEGKTAIRVVQENNGRAKITHLPIGNPSFSAMDLLISVHPKEGTATPAYSIDGGSFVSMQNISIQGELLNAVQGKRPLAVGLIASCAGSHKTFPATWDYLEIK